MRQPAARPVRAFGAERSKSWAGPAQRRCASLLDAGRPADVLIVLAGSGPFLGVACHDVAMIAAFSITPLGVGPSVSEPVAEAVRLVRASGLANETNAMFTNVEGEWDEVMGLIKACVMSVAAVAPRVSVVIKVDYRVGVTDGLHEKVDAIEQRLRTT
jgi:uncharacterized protein (TIGR00106 family)